MFFCVEHDAINPMKPTKTAMYTLLLLIRYVLLKTFDVTGGGDEILEVERLEVCHLLDIQVLCGCLGESTHIACLWHNGIDETGVF